MEKYNLIGEKVVSKHYGEGVIEKVEDKKVNILFDADSQLRVFTLQAFNQKNGEPSLKCVNDEAAQYIQSILNDGEDDESTDKIRNPVYTKRRLFYVFQGKTFERELSGGSFLLPIRQLIDGFLFGN